MPGRGAIVLSVLPQRKEMVDGIALSTHLQPMYSLPHQREVGYEALLRGEAPDGTLVTPFDLFGRTIVSGRMTELDRLSHLTHLSNAAPILPDAQWLFLNINPSIFTDTGYAARLAQLVRGAGLAPERLVIEVLESGGSDVADIAHSTSAFRAQGFLVAVDDFGAGHSNIAAADAQARYRQARPQSRARAERPERAAARQAARFADA